MHPSPKLSNDELVLEARIEAYLAGKLPGRDGEKLKRDVVLVYRSYVERIARGLARRSYDPVEDLIQVGCLGLIKALERYNPALKVRFKTYCTYHITGEMRHYLRDKANMIKPPRAVYELYFRMNQVVARLSAALGRQPTDYEIAQALECDTTQVRQVHEVERRQHMLPLDQFAVEQDGALTGDRPVLLERLVDEHTEVALAQLDNRLALERAMQALATPQQNVVRLYYYDEWSQPQIARHLGISQMQVSRRLRKALGQLETALGQGVQEAEGQAEARVAPLRAARGGRALRRSRLSK